LQDIAKYLVNEITQISVNKLKIDALNDTLNQKYFARDLLTKHEILANLVDEEEASAGQQLDKAATDESGGVAKNREELFEYYTNLERNLETVRAEIDKLKQEAFEDLAYISNILVEEVGGGEREGGEDEDTEMKLASEFDRQVGRIEEEIRDREMKLKMQEACISER
jgi:hypothetical protein